jgi:U3 small nucleolar RNA-associated protein 24
MPPVKRKVAKMLKPTDQRLQIAAKPAPQPTQAPDAEEVFTPSSMFFSYNPELGPPYRVIVDTNMLFQTCADKIDLVDGLSKCLIAKVIPFVTDCVIAELEKLGRKFHLALRLAKDPRVRTIQCGCRGNYADDCIVATVTQHRCFIVATNDKDLKRRIRKIPGVPIMYLHNSKFCVERLPDSDFGAPRYF